VRRLSRIAGRLALALGAFALADLAAGTLLLPHDLNYRSREPWFHHGLRPNASGMSQWGSGPLYPAHVNSLGFLDREVREVPLASDGRRVLLIGDSFTEGIGVPFEQTFAGILQERLAPEGIEVLNAGVMSFSPRLERLRLEQLFDEVGLEVDELVLLIDISDIQDQVLYRKFVPRHATAVESARAGAWRWVTRHSLSIGYAERMLAARRRNALREKYGATVLPPWLDYFWLEGQDHEPSSDPSFARVRVLWTGDEYFANPWTDLGLAMAREDLVAIAELCRRHGVELTLGVYPWPTQVRIFERESRQVYLWETFAAEHGLGFVSFWGDFMPEGDYDPEELYVRNFIEGDVHWNEAGHRLVADRLEPLLR
jgi:hypothetical protein